MPRGKAVHAIKDEFETCGWRRMQAALRHRGRVVNHKRDPGTAGARPRADHGETDGPRREAVAALRLAKIKSVSEWRGLPGRDTYGAGLQVVAPVDKACHSIRNPMDCAKMEAHR